MNGGNRYSTVLMYLQETELGGETVSAPGRGRGEGGECPVGRGHSAAGFKDAADQGQGTRCPARAVI
jgi:hypothetical protein